ncbi:hypothetical protein [Stutzerimonas tarimensis]|uniref:Uncharacterized protein n=1 Tax=Stutzerimonas tarimensis TaxID=1507735 RepID=A0ABV7T3D5_9GAMM
MGLYLSVTTASNNLKESPINRHIIRMASSAALLSRRGEIPASPSLDVTFMLPGKYDKPDFSGMRMGGYTPQNDTLFFQVAVPQRVLDSELTEPYMDLLLQDVVDNAAQMFHENSLAFDEAAWRRIIFTLSESAAPRPDLHLVARR